MMHTASILQPDSLDAFRTHARRFLAAGAEPATIVWTDRDHDTLFHDPPDALECLVNVPRAFIPLAESVACHRDPARWPLLYQALWRLVHGERALLEQATDPLIHRLQRMQSAVRRDQHRMTAFVRFRPIAGGTEDNFVAWYEPEHHVLRRTASFFVDRFTNMRFSILTPDLALHWDRHTASFGPGVRRSDAPMGDSMEEWWKRYYAATFNPARNNPDLLARHMPRRFWRNLPEATEIQRLAGAAGKRTERMIDPETHERDV